MRLHGLHAGWCLQTTSMLPQHDGMEKGTAGLPLRAALTTKSQQLCTLALHVGGPLFAPRTAGRPYDTVIGLVSCESLVLLPCIGKS